MRGQRSAFVRIMAFSVDMRSLGRFSLFHRAMVAASVSRVSTSKPSVMGMGGYACIYYVWVCICVQVCMCVEKGMML